MAYPRQCPHCTVEYDSVDATDPGHVTLYVVAGGTPSPRLSGVAGRLLTLRCAHCQHPFDWDYYASAPLR